MPMSSKATSAVWRPNAAACVTPPATSRFRWPGFVHSDGPLAIDADFPGEALSEHEFDADRDEERLGRRTALLELVTEKGLLALVAEKRCSDSIDAQRQLLRARRIATGQPLLRVIR